MDKNARIYIAGHNGLVGSALVRTLSSSGYVNLLLRSRSELELSQQHEVEVFFDRERPEFVFLAAAKVGGILANKTLSAEFIHDNLAIQTNVLHAAHRVGVKRLLFLGSSCVYPKYAMQPISESELLTGALEPTNRSYAVAKIAGIEMCWAYNRQHGERFLAVMPTNLYGPNDNYDAMSSHVIPALLAKFHQARISHAGEVVLWGTGEPLREFLHSDDAARACVLLMNLPDEQFARLVSDEQQPPTVNIGSGSDLSIRDLALLVAEITGFNGKIVFDSQRPDGTPRKLLDSTLIHSLGWRARISLREGLLSSYRDYLAQWKGSEPVAVTP